MFSFRIFVFSRYSFMNPDDESSEYVSFSENPTEELI